MIDVSCIIPTYGRPELLDAVKSVIDQTYKGTIEIVVVDDSKDHAMEHKVRKLAKEGRLILYVKLEHREGAPFARNVGIKISSGHFISFLDDDDLWYPEKIEKQMNLILQNPTCPLVICWSKDKRFGTERTNSPPLKINHKELLKSFNLSSTSSYLTRRSLYELLGGFDESLPASQEYDLAIRYSNNGHAVLCVPEVLIEQNSTKGQISENWDRKIRGVLGIFKKHHSEYRFRDYIKTFGVISLFLLAKVFGRKIYKIIIPMKKRYENEYGP